MNKKAQSLFGYIFPAMGGCFSPASTMLYLVFMGKVLVPRRWGGEYWCTFYHLCCGSYDNIPYGRCSSCCDPNGARRCSWCKSWAVAESDPLLMTRGRMAIKSKAMGLVQFYCAARSILHFQPNQIVTGGFIGIGQVIHQLIPAIHRGVVSITFNVPLFILIALRQKPLKKDVNGYDTLTDTDRSEMETVCADYLSFLDQAPKSC